jgi:Fic family protein
MMTSKADNEPATDNGESIGLMEPMLISASGNKRSDLADLALELTAQSVGFRKRLPDGVVHALADLVRSMNCYYSNLIEGHETHPLDIERALRNDFSNEPEKRDLQREAVAHIEVQKWIDCGGLDQRATTADGLLEVHRRFCELLPEDLLWVENPDTHERIKVVPGAYRVRDVAVGYHVPISAGAVPRFMERFEEAYARPGKVDSILAAATAHHRLLWIHPFMDGNGRVARLMSYAMLRETLDTGGVWSVARGLARNASKYKEHLGFCDQRRRNDFDGRGHLSEQSLAEFAEFFLKTCLDQVAFMERLIEPEALRNRILLWSAEESRGDRLPPKSGAVLEAILFRGELPRKDVERLLGASDRTARRLTSELIKCGVVTSESSRAPLRLAFPAALAERWMPGLFPTQKS